MRVVPCTNLPMETQPKYQHSITMQKEFSTKKPGTVVLGTPGYI